MQRPIRGLYLYRLRSTDDELCGATDKFAWTLGGYFFTRLDADIFRGLGLKLVKFFASFCVTPKLQKRKELLFVNKKKQKNFNHFWPVALQRP
jgi:hypothetical protein